MSFREIDVQHQDVTSGNNHATARLSCLMQLYAKFHKPVKQFLELIAFFGGMKTREGKEGLTETCIKSVAPRSESISPPSLQHAVIQFTFC